MPRMTLAFCNSSLILTDLWASSIPACAGVYHWNQLEYAVNLKVNFCLKRVLPAIVTTNNEDYCSCKRLDRKIKLTEFGV